MRKLSEVFRAPGRIAALALIVSAGAAQANNERVLYSFSGVKDGDVPSAVIRDGDGNLYGTTFAGLTHRSDTGSVFRLGPDGSYTALYRFSTRAKDGNRPESALIRDKSGNFYGTTAGGGAGYDVCEFGCGTIFRLAQDGSETVLHAFKGSDGANPIFSRLIRDRQGNLYGTTFRGGNTACVPGCGNVFKLTTTGELIVLHAFTGGVDGANPSGDLVTDGQGNLYGGTANGGTGTNCEGGPCGVLFKIAADGSFSVLYAFQGADGWIPQGPFVLINGDIYGITAAGGTGCNVEGGCGVAFRLTADGKESVLHAFTGGSDGANPENGLVTDSSGNLYGITVAGGLQVCPNGGCGVVFQLTPDGAETVLHSFDAGDGGFQPNVTLTPDKRGNLYGTTWRGGTYGNGTIFKIKK